MTNKVIIQKKNHNDAQMFYFSTIAYHERYLYDIQFFYKFTNNKLMALNYINYFVFDGKINLTKYSKENLPAIGLKVK